MKKLDTETFKERVIEKFGNIFILDKVNYVNSKTKVIITCPIHGDFEVAPNNFLSQGKGCPKCAIEQRSKNNMRTLEDVIKEVTRVHNGKYSYEHSVYNGMDNNITITCPIHGDFEQKVSHHLRGHGCPICAGNKIKTTEDFKKEFIEKFGNDFDLSKVEYKGNKTDVTIICPIHGEFKSTPNFLLSHGVYACPQCAKEKRGLSRRKEFDEFLKEAREIHGDKYEYYEDTYTTTHDKMKMKCTICGTEFEQTPHKHIGKEHNGCPKCARILTGLKCRKTYEEFLTDAREVHGDKYIYHDDYVNSHTKIKITCKEHGDFWQMPYLHTSLKNGCPIYAESHLEREVRLFLMEKNIKFEYEKKFDWLGKQSLDFYLVDFNVAIECQGRQHFGVGGWDGEDDGKIIERDIKKNQLVNENGVKLIYYCNPKDKELIKECGVDIYNEENTIFDLEYLLEKIIL